MNLTPWVRTDTPLGVPGWPTVRPFMEVWREGSPPTLLEVLQMASYIPDVAPGTFRFTTFLGTLYGTPGRHYVFIRWTDQNGVPRLIAGSFELVAGGSPAGTVISMFEVARPDARYLLTATDAGTITRRKNPR